MHPPAEPFRLREIWPPGTIIKGDYEIKTKLGGGGFGTVYLAQHRFLGTTHVIKRLHEQYASDPDYVRKFVTEARAVSRLKACPNVVEVQHMTQSEDGHLILVMEYIAGGDLAGLMAARQLRVDEVLEYSRQIAFGLDAAHTAGLVHRDVKPQNVMLSQDSTGRTVLKLIDFGIVADHLSTQQTSVMRGGSIGFAAPEQWVRAGKELDGRTDLYSLGATMYRMLCGRMPYESNDIGDWIDKVKKGPPVSPSQVRKDVPKELSSLVLDLLSLRPERRPANAATVIQRLDELRLSTVTLPALALSETRLSNAPRKTWPIWTGAACLAVALSAGAWFTFGSKESPPEPANQGRPATTVKKTEPVAPPPKPVVIPKQEDPPKVIPPQPVEQKDSRPEPVVTDKKQPEKVPGPVKPPSKPVVIPKQEDPPKVTPKPAEPVVTIKKEPEKVPTPAPPPPQPKAAPVIDHAALGDTALNAGDYRSASAHFKALGDAQRLAKLQRAVEADVDERATILLEKGQSAGALRLVDSWVGDFPRSVRLQSLRAKIVRARETQ